MNRSVDDSALLQQPIQTAAQGVASVVGYWQTSTSEVKNLLTNECEIILECKFCRSFYRTIRDFLSHKRQYCRTLLVQPNLKASRATLEIIEQAQAQLTADSLTKESSSGVENVSRSAKKTKKSNAESGKPKSNLHYAFNLPASSEKMDLMSMPRLSKPPSADESDDEQASMPQLTMEEKIPPGRVALVPERSLRSRRLNPLQKSISDVKEAVMSEESIARRMHSFLPSLIDTEGLKCLHKGCKEKFPFASIFALACHVTLSHNRRFPSSNSMPCFLCGQYFQRYNSVTEHIKEKHEKHRKQMLMRTPLTDEKEARRGKKSRFNRSTSAAHSRSLSPAVNEQVASEDASDPDDIDEAPKLELMSSNFGMNFDSSNNEAVPDSVDATQGQNVTAEDEKPLRLPVIAVKEKVDTSDGEGIKEEKSSQGALTVEEEVDLCVDNLLNLICGTVTNTSDERDELESEKTTSAYTEAHNKEKDGVDVSVKERKGKKRINPVWLNAYRQKSSEEKLRRQQQQQEASASKSSSVAVSRAVKKTSKKGQIGEGDSSKYLEKVKRGEVSRIKCPTVDWDPSGDEGEKRINARKGSATVSAGGSDDEDNDESGQSDENERLPLMQEQVEAVHEISSRPSRKRRKPNWIDDNDYVTTEFRKKYSRRSGTGDNVNNSNNNSNSNNININSDFEQSESGTAITAAVHRTPVEGSTAETQQQQPTSPILRSSADAPELKRSDTKSLQADASIVKGTTNSQKATSPERVPEAAVATHMQYTTPSKHLEIPNESAYNKKKVSKELRLHYTPRARKLKFGDTQPETDVSVRESSGASTSEVTASPNSRRKQNLSKLGEGDDVTIVSFPNGRPPPCPQDLSSIPVYLTEMQRERFFSFIRPVSSSTDGAHKCMQCGQIVASMMEGRRHAVGHLRIMRLRCALCDCGSFFCSDMRTHLQMRYCEMLYRAPKGYVLPGDVTPCMTDAQADELTKLVDPMKPGRVMYTSGKIVSAASHKPYYPDAEIEERVLGSARPTVPPASPRESTSPVPKAPDG